MSNFRYTRPDPFPPIVKNLIIINVLVYVTQLVFAQYDITEKLQLYPAMPEKLHDILVNSGIPNYREGRGFRPYQIATHMFTHSPGFLFHIVFNMFALWMFGRVLENVWGPKRFLLFYLACGVGAAACHLAIQYFRCTELLQLIENNANPSEIASGLGAVAPAVGASGAVMGIFAAFAYLFPNTELYLMFLPIPIKAKWLVLGLAAFDLIGGVTNASGDNIAHFAHLGGAATGFILVLIWNRRNRRRFY